MTGFKKSSTISRQSSYKSLYVNPLTEIKHNRSNSEGGSLGLHLCRNPVVICGKENAAPSNGASKGKPFPGSKPISYVPLQNKPLKPSSLQLCIQKNEPDSSFGSAICGDVDANSNNAWYVSDSEVAPASSWSTLPNRSLLCRPLPLDIGRCTCIIVKESSDELNGASLYSFYTNEGEGRKDRKLAVARHQRKNGRSEFIIAQSAKGILCSLDDCFLGTITSNLMGSRYHIWDQGNPPDSPDKQSKLLLAVVVFNISMDYPKTGRRKGTNPISFSQSFHITIGSLSDMNWTSEREEDKPGLEFKHQLRISS